MHNSCYVLKSKIEIGLENRYHKLQRYKNDDIMLPLRKI